MTVNHADLLENTARKVATFAGIDTGDQRLVDHHLGNATQPDQRLADAVATAEEILLPLLDEIASLEHDGSMATTRYAIVTQRLTQLDEYMADMPNRLPGDMRESFHGNEFWQWLRSEIENRPTWADQGGPQA